ncbi:MAG: hypothetical protein AAGF95_30320 [Chloroflexota bacterium]
MSSLFAFNNSTTLEASTMSGFYDAEQQLWVTESGSHAETSPEWPSICGCFKVSRDPGGGGDVEVDVDADI